MNTASVGCSPSPSLSLAQKQNMCFKTGCSLALLLRAEWPFISLQNPFLFGSEQLPGITHVPRGVSFYLTDLDGIMGLHREQCQIQPPVLAPFLLCASPTFLGRQVRQQLVHTDKDFLVLQLKCP